MNRIKKVIVGVALGIVAFLALFAIFIKIIAAALGLADAR